MQGKRIGETKGGRRIGSIRGKDKNGEGKRKMVRERESEKQKGVDRKKNGETLRGEL